MLFSKFINLPVFIVSFLIGLFAVFYSMEDNKKNVYVYPTPDNVRVLQFKDNVDNCFEFKETEVVCPKDESKITHYIPQ